MKIDTFTSSLGYIDRFKRRYGISFKHFYGNAGSVEEGTVTEWFAKLPEILKSFDEKDIYKWDESALCFLQTKNASLVTKEEAKNRDARGAKQDKQ